MTLENIRYKWTKIFAAKRFGGKDKITLTALEQDELLADLGVEEKEEEKPVLVGHLNKRWGLNGFKDAQGSEVYEFNGKYFFDIESMDGKTTKRIPFKKEELQKAIDFI